MLMSSGEVIHFSKSIVDQDVLRCVSGHALIAVGGTAKKLELAKELGATHTINTKEVEDVVEEIKLITDGGAHYTIDTTGIPNVLKNDLYSLRTLGVCAEVGVSGDVTLNVFDAIMADILVTTTEHIPNQNYEIITFF